MIERFPNLALDSWRSTRDALHGYVKVAGSVRAALSPRQKHWWHLTLFVAADGLTTPALPIPGDAGTCEIRLDLRQHKMTLVTGSRIAWEATLRTAPPLDLLADQLLAALRSAGIDLDIDRAPFAGQVGGEYDVGTAESFLTALQRIDAIFRQFKANLPGETSAIHLWPHGFDLAFMWLSGRKVSGQDPENEEWADEQMGFGFSTGDAGIPNPYFYITAYPWPEGITHDALPAPAFWHTASWKGAVLMYDILTTAADPDRLLLDFLAAGYGAAATRMAS